MRQMQLAAVVAVVLVTACAAHSDCDVLHSTTQRACDVFGSGSIGCQGLQQDLLERCDRLEPAVVPQTRQLGDIAEEEEDQNSVNHTNVSCTGEKAKTPEMGPWEGSFNSTHASANSSSDGMSEGCKKKAFCSEKEFRCQTNNEMCGSKPCLGKVQYTCTSCAPGRSFIMRNQQCDLYKKCDHYYKKGICDTPTDVAKVSCTKLDGSENKLCTKIMVDRSKVKLKEAFPQSSPEYQLLEPLYAEPKGVVQARCRVWKQTICRDAVCRSRKEVECLNVCKLTCKGIYCAVDETTCDAKYCTNTTTYELCNEIAMMA